MAGVEIGSRGASAISEALMNNSSLLTLDLEGEKCHYLGKTIVVTIKVLIGNKIDEECGKDLGELLKKNTTMTELDIGCFDKWINE